MYKFLRATLWTVILMLLGSTVAFCATTDFGNVGEPSYKLVHTLDSSEVFVATYDVTDYGAVADGQTDNTNIFQKLLDKVGDLGGGIVYVPSGRYAIRGALSIPKGVTLRGDWQKPSRSNSTPIGTLLMAYTGRNGNERTTPFVEMAPETGIMDLTIWYPEQDSNNITPYSPTIRYGFNNYFGNEYCNTKNVTLLNSYIGILFNYDNGGASPVVNGLYGTTLCKGIEIDKIADVGRIENVNLSPDYWKNSGVTNAPNTTSFNDYMYNNSIGIVMRRNDWSYTCNININGYNIGYDTEKTLSTDDNATPNGHHYNFDLSGCKTGIQINATNSVGILFDEINIHNCENGIVLGENTSDAAQFTKTKIDVSKYAIRIPDTSSTKLTFNSSKVSRGRVAINSGTFVANNTTFSNSTPQIYYGTSGRGDITGCAFTKGRKITNKSVYESTLSDSVAVTCEVSDFTKVEYDSHTPKRTVLYNATASPYNASTGSNDNTSAIQKALNQASNDGGGIVFLPSGKYKIRGHLTIPSNVELRGAVDLWSVPHGSGTILEAYENRNNPNGDSFIQLKADSGIRGIVVDYPEQVFSGSADWLPAKYPYTIQGQGANVYVIDSGVRAAYKALDLFTYKCDNHYVDFLGGHAFDTGVRVGGNSVNGKLYNLMFNVIVYACGNESKYGSFSNMPNGVSNAPLYSYGLEHLDFLVLGDCDNETLYNDFHYGSYRGTLLQNDGNGGPSGRSMGLGVDGSTRAVYWASGVTKSFDFDNSQIVSIGDNNPKTAYFYSEENSNFKSTFNNCDFWGQPQRGIILNSGNLTLCGAHFNNPGQQTLASVSNASLNILASASNQNGTAFVDSGSEKNISISGSVLNNRNSSAGSFKAFDSNMGLGSTVSSSGALSQVSGRDTWKATASNNNYNAKNALDGNAATRWDTSGSQTPGQWFMVDFGKTLTYNTIICDVGSSTSSDAPAAYEIYVSSNGTDWGNAIASGTTTNGIIKVNVQNSRYVKIVQTGSKSNYWSIHEFYVLNAAANNDLISDEDESKAPEETTTEETTKPEETTTPEQTTKETTTKPSEPETDYSNYSGNPFITSIFTADPSARVWNGRVYVYASHDMDPARGCDLMDKYHVYSSDNMVDWIDEGEILNSSDVSWGRTEGGFMWAPDCAYKNGTYYFYYPHPSDTDWNNSWKIGVATSNSPAKDFKDTGKYIEGLKDYSLIDPCVFTDDDGTSYIYIGGGNKCVGAKLNDDMVSINGEVKDMTGLYDFHEAAWVFKRNGIYYMMYADNTNPGNCLRYATSNSPLGPWDSKGIVLDSVGSYTSHGSITEFKGQWYLFYHDQDISNQGELRSICVDKLSFNADGTINKVVQTDTGVPLVGTRDAESKYSTIYSVKDAKTNLAAIVDNSNAYEGKSIGNMHIDNASFTLNNINGGKGGRANILVHYASNDSVSKIHLMANDIDYSTINLLSSGSWDKFEGTSNITVTLNAGANNTLTFTHGTGGANIDYVKITLLDEDEIKVPEETTKPEETTTVEPTTKPEETTTVEPKGEFISDDVKVIGYQISAVLRGSRVLYSSEPTIKGQKVVSSGLIYGFANGPITKNDVVLNSNNKYIASYEATLKGVISNYNGDSATATYYARTMTHNGYGAARYNAKYYVRAYSVLENGAIAYSEVYDFSLYSIADTLYQNNLMPTYDGHQYLFYNILTVVDPDYKEIPYKWNSTISK